MEAKLLNEYYTPFCADSVEWCPIQPFWNVFVCGNYQLAEDESNGASDAQRARFGRILLFQVDDELHLLQDLETAAILDQKWCSHEIDDKPTLAVVTADATLDLYTLDVDDGQPKLKLRTNFKFQDDDDDDDLVLLSVDWSTGKYASNDPRLVCSDNKGFVHCLHLLPSGLRLIHYWEMHSEEAWIAAFDYWHPNILFSGGDDNAFVMTKLDCPAHLRNKVHQSGVTSIHSNKSKEHILATGSYDGFVRYWDARMWKSPRESVKMPGPVWRVKWDPKNQEYLLTACMVGGVAIIDKFSHSTFEIISTYKGHKSITYGVDWSYDCATHRIASCSYYDMKLCTLDVAPLP